MLEICTNKTRLLMEYQHTAERYSSAVSELARKLGTVPKDEYARLHREAELARLASMDARKLLEQHIEQHGC
jgi:hypothetical protein